MMPETPDDPNALYEAYHHAEKLLDAGTAEQSVIFTLMGRGMSHDQAVEIVNDLAGARVKRPQRFRTKTDVAAARHAAKETMLFGLANCGTGLIVGLVVTLFVVHTDWVAFIGYL